MLKYRTVQVPYRTVLHMLQHLRLYQRSTEVIVYSQLADALDAMADAFDIPGNEQPFTNRIGDGDAGSKHTGSCILN